MSTVEWHKDDQDEDGEGVIFITLEQDAFKCVVVLVVASLQNAATTTQSNGGGVCVRARYVVSSLSTKKVPFLFSHLSPFI